MFKILATILLFLSLFSSFASGQSVAPTLGRNNSWTGYNSYLAGHLSLGTATQNCPQGAGYYMTGLNSDFSPSCQSISVTAGVQSLNTRTGAITLNQSSSVVITEGPTGTFTFSSPGAGVTTVNGTSGAITLANGTNINIVQSPSGTFTINCSGCTGGGGTGTVASGSQYQNGGYNASGTTIGPLPDVYTLNPGMTSAQITTFLASLSSPASVYVPNGVTTSGYTQNFNVSMISAQAGASLFPVLANGGACDARKGNVSFTSGSNVATGSFSSSDVGKTIVAAGPFGGTQYVFTPTIIGYTNSTTVTLSTNAPFTQTSQYDPIGTMSTTGLQAILNQMGDSFPGQFPSGCTALSDTLYWNAGQIIAGQSSEGSGTTIMFVDGHDGIAQPDASGLGGAGYAGAGISNLNIVLGGRVDAARAPVTYVNSAGTVNVQAALYRPDHYLMSDTADPLAPGWCSGVCQNGVASTTQNSGNICVPTSYFSRLTAAAGNVLTFRDFPVPYKGTVTSLTGSGCAGGFSAATISPILTNTSSYTKAQVEWVQSTVGFQTIATAISAGPVTYPFTVSLGTSISPGPNTGIPNFPTHGHIKIANGEEYTYIGANYLANTAVIRGGPSTSAGQAANGVVFPTNPCPAVYDQPWPVTPTINSGDSTPSGANYFPSRCLGNAAISFPQANGNVYSQGGLVKGFIENLSVSVFDTYHSNTLDTNSTTCIYMAGNTIPYDSDIGFVNCVGTEYGFDIAPSSAGMAGVAANAVDSVNSHYHDFTLRTGYPISITGSNQFHINDVDAYSTAYNPFDGTDMGAGESLMLGYSLNEQTGGLVTNTAVCNVSNFNAEPEGGNSDEVPTYFESDCYSAIFSGNNFEGIPAVLGGGKQIIEGGQFSSSQAAPILNYGVQNVIENTDKTSQGVVSTTYGVCSYCDWGQFNRSKIYSAGGLGPIISPGVGNRNSYDGDDSTYALLGVYSTVSPTNILAGFISNDEMASTGLTKTIDMTAPKGSYVTCNINGSTSCNAQSFNGFSGGILIGPFDRLQNIPNELTVWLKATSGTPSFLMYVQALSGSYATCSSAGTIINPLVTVSTTWTAYSFPIDLSSRSGCDLGFSFGPTTGAAATVEISSPFFMPQAGLIHGSTTAYTNGAACPSQAINGDILSFDGVHFNVCYGGVVVQH